MFTTHVAAEQVAAIIFEPVQGEGGFVVPPAEWVRGLREIADANGIVLIADEVQSGYGRTGKMFGIEHFGVEPDLITVAKSIAAGVPISGVIGRADVMDAAGDSTIGGTYVGSPLGCVAGIAVLDEIERRDLLVARHGHRRADALAVPGAAAAAPAARRRARPGPDAGRRVRRGPDLERRPRPIWRQPWPRRRCVAGC